MSEQAGVGSENETHAPEVRLGHTLGEVRLSVKAACHWSCSRKSGKHLFW